MKLQELDAPHQTKQTAKVFESYFGQKVSFDSIPSNQAYSMLSKVRELIKEHRRQPEFHYSEHNPAYLKLIVLEQGLVQCLRKTLKESEIQQAQVVLAAQDIVDQMQKMIEQTSEMLYKELPALTDSIKYELSPDKAQAFNQTAAAGLQGLLESLQASKGQMDTALAGLTGQATGAGLAPPPGDIAGADIGAELGAEAGADMGAAADDELSAVDMPPPEEEVSADIGSEESLGRARK